MKALYKKVYWLSKVRQLIFIIIVYTIFLPHLNSWGKVVDQINVYNPFLDKIPVAVPKFKNLTSDTSEIELGNKAQSILKNALDFTGYLKILNLDGFLFDPSKTGIKLQEVNFKNWGNIGADLLVTGGIENAQGQIKLELRLFDTLKSKLVVGRAYVGPESQLREMIHRFCAEVSYALTGKWGVFNSRLAFVSTTKNGKKEIFSSDFDGMNIIQMTAHNNLCLSPAWSYDGQWLAYVSYHKGKPDIYIKNLTKQSSSVINYKGMNISPEWMPNKLNLLAVLSFSGIQEIYLLTIKGEIIKKLSNSWGINVSPKVSPDGNSIVFTSDRAGTPQIYIKDLRTGEVRRLTFQGRYNTSPSWSPDGNRIVYAGIEKNQSNLFVIKVGVGAGSGVPIQLTRNQGNNEDPAWSPDGSLIAFSSNREGQGYKIYVMTAAGTDQRRLFSMQGEQTQPAWSKPVEVKNW